MGENTRWRFLPEYMKQLVAQLSELGAALSGVASELGVTPMQLKT